MISDAWRQFAKRGLNRLLGLEVKRFKNKEPVVFSKGGKKWDYSPFETYWVGGKFDASNHSHGYSSVNSQSQV